MKTVQSAGLLTRSKFIRRFYHLDKVEKTLRVFSFKKERTELK